MHGVKIPEKATDDMPTEELPYLELLYRFVFGERSYYNLEITKDVKPKAKDNDDEEELRQRGEGGRSQKAIKDEARTLPVRGHAVTERPQQVHEYFDPFDIEREEYDLPLKGFDPLDPQRAHLAIEQSSTAVLPPVARN